MWSSTGRAWTTTPSARTEGKAKGPGLRFRIPGPSLWWRHGDSNPEPPACKAGALPIAPCPHKKQPVNHTLVPERLLPASRPGIRLFDLSVESLQTVFRASDSCTFLTSRTPAIATATTSNFFTCTPFRLGVTRTISKTCAGSVGVPGLEPGTSSLSAKRSNRLSYTPRCLIGPRHDFTAHPGPISNRGISPVEFRRKSTDLVVRQGHADAAYEGGGDVVQHG